MRGKFSSSALLIGMLTLASPVAAQSLDTTTKVLTGTYLGLHVIDLTQTSWGAGGSKIHELNPIFRPLMDKPEAFALTKIGLASVGAIATWKLKEKHPKLALGLGIAMNVVQGFVVANNARAIR